MLRLLKNIYEMPKKWLTAGVILISSSLVIGYHQDQRLADATLAAMGEKPLSFAVQEITRESRSGASAEFQLFAEARLETSAIHPIGSEETERTYVLLPIYAVSETGRLKANRFLRRNSEEPLPGQYQEWHLNESGDPVPAGILIFEVSTEEMENWRFETLGIQRLGRGLNGEVILLSGSIFSPTNLPASVDSQGFDSAVFEIIGEGADFLPLIAPIRASGAASSGSATLTALRDNCLMLGFAFLFCGAFGVLKHYVPEYQRPDYNSPVNREVDLSNRTFDFFEPIASQDELLEEDEGFHSSVAVSRAISRAADTIGRNAIPRIKSRL
ncbi:MAG: hypothetical protein ACR2O1_14850 [Boseongicola sp.]